MAPNGRGRTGQGYVIQIVMVREIRFACPQSTLMWDTPRPSYCTLPLPIHSIHHTQQAEPRDKKAGS